MESFHDSASALYRNNITPLLHKCASYINQPSLLNPDNTNHYHSYGSTLASMKAMSFSSSSSASSTSIATIRSLQHAESLKWQQEVFHRLLHLICLAREGLATQVQVEGCKAQILAFLQSTHPDGEWPEFTRDKLLFLQDLLFAACITEKEYHDAKKALILRLADQGATIDAQDFIFDTHISRPPVCESTTEKAEKAANCAKSMARRKAKAKPEPEPNEAPVMLNTSDVHGPPSTKPATTSSPLKQVIGAMSRISKSPTSKAKLPHSPLKVAENNSVSCSSPRVPHPFDYLRPEHCPERDPPSPHQHPFFHPKPLDINMSKELDTHEGEIHNNELGHAGAENADASMDHGVPLLIASPNRSSSAILDSSDCTADHNSPMDKGSTNKSSNNTPSRFKSMINGLIQKKVIHSVNEPEEQELEGEKDFSHTNFKSGSSRWGIPGLIQKRNVVSDVAKSSNPHTFTGCDSEETAEKPYGKGKWGLDMFRLPKKLQFDPFQQEVVVESDTEKPCQEIVNEAPPAAIPVDRTLGKGPIAKGLKKKLHFGTAPSDFVIDKVLGENIKNELSRILAEMNQTQPGQMFTNEQIDAIAARLPMDTTELKKFFPQTWCEKYGDIVLEVVQKEFKEHVNDMKKLGKPVKERRAISSTVSSPMKKQNDENDHTNTSQHHRALRAPDLNKCFSTLNENTHTTVTTVLSPAMRKQKSQHSPSTIKEKNSSAKYIGRFKDADAAKHGDENLDFMHEEEVLKMPLQRHNDYGSHLRA